MYANLLAEPVNSHECNAVLVDDFSEGPNIRQLMILCQVDTYIQNSLSQAYNVHEVSMTKFG
jgi:hypothetical protein